MKLITWNSVSTVNTVNPYHFDYAVNVTSEHLDSFANPLTQARWKVYRCQLNTKEETCCCSCNSDTMFEVMKSLYDCYKKKNCDHCNCILCGHLPKEERRLGEIRKSVGGTAPLDAESASAKEKKKQKLPKAEKALDGTAPSEKGLVKKIKTESKTTAQKEKLLKGLAMNGIPLPESKTLSEKKVIDKVRTDLGLPPEPKNLSEKDKYNQGIAAGLIVPLEGKTPIEKEKILKAQDELGIPLPEGRTNSEKGLIQKIKSPQRKTKTKGISVGKPALSPEKAKKLDSKTAKVIKEGKGPSDQCICDILTPESERISLKPKVSKVTSEKLKASKASIQGKTPQEKEKILNGRLAAGLPLPEGKTPSEKQLIKKVKAASGYVTPTGKTSSKAAIPSIGKLRGKTPSQKEKILRSIAKQGLQLPEGKTPSEKALIDKIKAAKNATTASSTPSEKLRKAKAAGLITPSEGKTPSEKSIMHKMKTPVTVPSEKLRAAKAAGLLTPLSGKTPEQKEKILRGRQQAGLPLPEGKTPSETELIKKVKKDMRPGSGPPGLSPEKRQKLDKKTAKIVKEGKGPSDECICSLLTPVSERATKIPSTVVPSEKLRKAKAAGLLTPLEGETPAQKEKIIKGLAMEGLPIPEGKTTSQKNLVDKVRADIGLPPEPQTPAEKKKYSRALAAGTIVPLEGKTPAEKDKILREQAKLGIPLPKGRSPSEKALIDSIKVKSKMSLPPSARRPSENISKIKEVDLLTPMERKTLAQKEKLGPPALSSGKRQKLNEKTAKVIKEGKGPSDECICSLLTPESNRSAKTKSSDLRKPLVDKTPSSREKPHKSVEKIGKRKTKSKKIGSTAAKKSAKEISVGGKSAGIVESYEDILKTTTCDRGCGCDKKKIRFKHSYVKIKVTSPDISSLCPCPDECIPGVKNGVFTDNKGIKVTVGRALGIPSFSMETPKKNIPISIYINENFTTISTNSVTNGVIHSILYEAEINSSNAVQYLFRSSRYTNHSEESLCSYYNGYNNICNQSNPYVYDSYQNNFNPDIITNLDYEASQLIERNMTSHISVSIISKDCSKTSGSSFESIYVIKSESSISFSTESKSTVENISVMSLVDNCTASHSSDYLYHSQSESLYNEETVDDEEYFTNITDYSTIVSEICNGSTDLEHVTKNKSVYDFKDNEVIIFRASGFNILNLNEKCQKNKITDKSILVINDLKSEHDIRAIVDEIISKKLIDDMSSVCIFVPSSDGVPECISYSSTMYIQMSKNLTNWRNGFKINTRRKMYAKAPNRISNDCETDNESILKIYKKRYSSYFKNNGIKASNDVSVDTTCDRPCCCEPKVLPKFYASSEQCVAPVVSEILTPMIMKQSIVQGLNVSIKNIPGIDVPRQSLYGLVQVEPTPVRACIVPPCSGSICHDVTPSRNNATSKIPVCATPSPDINISQPCNCKLVKSKELIKCGVKKYAGIKVATPVNMPISKREARGYSQSDPMTTLNQIPDCTPTNNNSCGTCGTADFPDSRKKSCFCSGKEKKVKIETRCPCAVYGQPPTVNGTRENKSVSCECEDITQSDSHSKNNCICKNKKKKKKKIFCECPEVVEPEELEPCMDEKSIRKMQSDLTQTTSGFKLHKQKKSPPEEEMSYEDIMNYFKALEDEGLDNKEGCDCEPPPKKPEESMCECEPEPKPAEDDVHLTGLKLHIGAKGTGSKGLSGICCFDVQIQENKRVKFKSSHLLVIT